MDLQSLVDLMTKSKIETVYADDGVVASIDQAAARAVDELQNYFDVDLSDPATARVASAVAIYVMNRGRGAADCVHPLHSLDLLRMYRGIDSALTGIGAAVLAKHGDGS